MYDPSVVVAHDGTGPRINPTACDREPIHIPGSIQPHGFLLVADASTLSVVAAAGDVETRIGSDWLGRGLSEILSKPVASLLEARPANSTIALGQVQFGPDTFDMTAHRSPDAIIVECEPAPETIPTSIEVLSAMEEAAATFEQAYGLTELCERAAVAFRNLTGFDRVMIYRFLDDDAGVVLAEDGNPDLPSFLNQHFPASDIPTQARALYIRNRVRVIPDISYKPAPLRPSAFRDVDLSDVGLRSVSPTHLKYLANMGVAASASVSIVRDGSLWGLIACHNSTPKHLALHQRMACRALAGSLSRQIRAKEDAESFRERIRLRAAEDAVVLRLGGDATLEAYFEAAGEELRHMLGADSFAAVREKELYVSGRSPRPEAIRDIAAHLVDEAKATTFWTDRLSELLPLADGCKDLASGVLAITISAEAPIILMWFRAEQVEVVNWAGNPHKDAAGDAEVLLTPRASFDSWTETVRGRSAPWTFFEIEAASRLRKTMFEARQNRRLSEVNRELTATIADNESLLSQKDYLMKEVHHRVQNSLQLVSAFLGLQSRTVGDAVLTGHLAEAQRRLAAVAMVHRRLHTDEHVQAVDLARYIGNLCSDITSTMDKSWGDQLTLELTPILISSSRAISTGLILTELLINANKYAYGGEPGPIAIVLRQQRNSFCLTVADRGNGLTSDGKGFGTRMLEAMVSRLLGKMEQADNCPGLRVSVIAPISGA